MDVDQLIDDIISREGGYVNDKSDPGGATKYGITIGTLSAFRGQKVTVQDVKTLSKDEAKQIYLHRYLKAPHIDRLPTRLLSSVFDMYVNAGTNATKILQKTLNAFGENLTVDGIIGPVSISASEQVEELAGDLLVDAYGIERRNYYYKIADMRPSLRKYARTQSGGKGGWIKRAELFISEHFWLSDAEHAKRTQAWG